MFPLQSSWSPMASEGRSPGVGQEPEWPSDVQLSDLTMSHYKIFPVDKLFMTFCQQMGLQVPV